MNTKKSTERSPLDVEGLSLGLIREEILASIQDGRRKLPVNLEEEDDSAS